jgi:hypothetical protein
VTVPPPGPRALPHLDAGAIDSARKPPAGALDASFADLLQMGREPLLPRNDGPLEDLLPPQVEFESQGRIFRAQMSIADNAIRFDARPVVSPAEIGRIAPGPLDRPGTTLAHEKLGASDPMAPSATAALSLEREAQPGVRYPAGERVAPAPGGRDAAAAPIRQQVSVAVQPGRPARPVHEPAKSFAGEASAARLAQNPATKAARPTPASIALLPNEVLVTLRGVSLTSAERADLARDVQDLLRRHGLGNRPIRFQANSRSAKSWP